MHIGHAGDVLDMVLPCKSIYNSTCRSPVSCSGEPTATCLCVYLAASGLNPIGGALLHLLPGRATGAATAAGDQPPPPERRAGAPPATRAPRCRTPLAAAQIGRSPQAAAVNAGPRWKLKQTSGEKKMNARPRSISDLIALR